MILKAKTLIDLTLYKSILFNGEFVITVNDIKKTFKQMNKALKYSTDLYIDKFSVDKDELVELVKENFEIKNKKLYPSLKWINNLDFVYLASRDNCETTIKLFKSIIENHFTSKYVVQALNEKIIKNVKNPELLKELNVWRAWTTDKESEVSDYYYLSQWDKETKSRKNFHAYKISDDIPKTNDIVVQNLEK